MKEMFHQVTRMALAEIVLNHAQESKYGYLLTEERMEVLVDRLHEFFSVSRNMKSAGDRLMSSAPQPQERSRRGAAR